MTEIGCDDRQSTKACTALEDVRASVQDEEHFDTQTPLQQATQLLMEKICALNMGVMEALVGIDSRDVLRIIAEDLRLHTDRFLNALEEEEKILA